MSAKTGRARHVQRCRRCGRYVCGEGLCALCDGVLKLLPPMQSRVKRHCVHCGHPFEVYGASARLTCGPRCRSRRWRAIRMLAASTPDE